VLDAGAQSQQYRALHSAEPLQVARVSQRMDKPSKRPPWRSEVPGNEVQGVLRQRSPGWMASTCPASVLWPLEAATHLQAEAKKPAMVAPPITDVRSPKPAAAMASFACHKVRRCDSQQLVRQWMAGESMDSNCCSHRRAPSASCPAATMLGLRWAWCPHN
jgi:hypothetical protein